MTYAPTSYPTFQPTAPPLCHHTSGAGHTTAPFSSGATFAFPPQAHFATQQIQPHLSAMLEARIVEIVREACEPTRQALEETKALINHLEVTVRSQQQWLDGFGARTDRLLSHLESFPRSSHAKRHAHQTPAHDDGPSMPPLVDDEGTLFYPNGVTIRGSAAHRPQARVEVSKVVDVVVAEEDECANMPELVDATGATAGAPLQQFDLATWLNSCAWPGAPSLDKASRDAAPRVAVEQAHTQVVPDSDDVEQDHDAATVVEPLEPERGPSPTPAEADHNDDGEAAALKVRRLEVKLLRTQLLLVKKQLEQLTEDAEDLDLWADVETDNDEE